MKLGRIFGGLSAALVVSGCMTIFNAQEAQRALEDKGEGVRTEASAKLDLTDYSLKELVDFAMTNRPSMIAAALAVVDARLALKEIAADAPLVSGTPWNSPHLALSGGHSESSLADSRLRSRTYGNCPRNIRYGQKRLRRHLC